MRSTITILLISLLASPLTAQEEKDRLALARERLAGLRQRVEALPEPAETDFRQVPTPTLRALDLARELREFARLNDDLPLAAEAWRLEAMTRRSEGDVVRAVDALKRAAEKEEDPQRVATDQGAAAELMARFGAIEEAREKLAELAEALPGHSLAPVWKRRAGELEQDQKEQLNALDVVARSFASRGHRSRALHSAQVFAFKNPLHPDSGALLERLIKELESQPVGAKLGYLERIAFYRPDDPGWVGATRNTLAELAREGHYEKAVLYSRLMLARSEILAPGEAARLTQTTRALRARLARVAARRLEVKPPTKDKRYRDLFRRARGGEDAETLQEIAGGFIEDYPECSEIPEIRVLCAGALEKDLPEEALTHYKGVAENNPGSEHARAAFTAAANLIEKSEGPDAAESWLASLGPRYESPDDQARIALLRARILDDAEQWEKARTALKAVAPTDPFVKREVEQRIKALDAKIDG